MIRRIQPTLTFIIAVLALASTSAEATITVKSYNPARNKVIFDAVPDDVTGLNPGYRLTLKIDETKTCDLEVLETKPDQVVADSTLCPFKKEIQPGQIAAKTNFDGNTVLPADDATTNEPTDISEDVSPEVTPAPSSSRFAFDIGILYSSNDKYDVEGSIEPSGREFDSSFETDPAFGMTLGFTFRQAPERNWFIHGALLIEFPRDIKTGGIVNFNSDSNGELTYVALYGNFAYEVAKPFYVFAGLGYGALAFSDIAPEIKPTAGVLLQAGVGVHMLSERVYIELLGRIQSSSARQDFSGGVEVKYDSIYAAGAVLTARYAFF